MTDCLFKAWLGGGVGSGHVEGLKRMVARGQFPPPLPVTMSYYSKSEAENSSLKRIIFVSVKLQSRAPEELATEMFFRSGGVLGQKGKQWVEGSPPLLPGSTAAGRTMAHWPRLESYTLPAQLAAAAAAPADSVKPARVGKPVMSEHH